VAAPLPLLGRYHEAIASLERDPSAAAAARLGDLYLGRGDAESAALHLRRARGLEPRSVSVALALADAEKGAGRRAESARVLTEVLSRGRLEDRHLSAAAGIALEAGAFGLARDVAERLRVRDEDASSALDVLGHLALFAGETREAERLGDRLVGVGHARAGLTLRGGARVLAGQDGLAMRDLEDAIATGDEPWEARTFRAELLVRHRGGLVAAEEADRAASEAPGFSLSARILGVLAQGQNAPKGRGSKARDAYDEGQLAEVTPGVRGVLEAAGDPKPTAPRDPRALSRALTLLGGNRTASASIVKERTLLAVDILPGPRWSGRALLSLVAVRPESRLREDFDALLAKAPGSSLPRCYRGELLSWLGDYSGARTDLDAALAVAPYSRWAYIGKATLENLAGHPEQALATLSLGVRAMDGTEGPGGYAVRGEALYLLGRARESVGELEQACRLHPRRVSAWIVLGLAQHVAGDASSLALTMRRLESLAYPLLLDAAESAGADLDQQGHHPRILAQARTLLSGNRSASLTTWHVPGAPLRALSGSVSKETVLRATV
jgi:tetratricopeptide (TPR) repeat protein